MFYNLILEFKEVIIISWILIASFLLVFAVVALAKWAVKP